MNIFSSFLVAVGLSMDNMAVTVSVGGSGSGAHSIRKIVQVSLLFALTHFMMFSVGFEGGMLVHAGRTWGAWIACAILVYMGMHMILSAQAEENTSSVFTSLKTQIALAVATSLDALFVGASLALVHAPFWQTQFWLVSCVFVTSLGGFYLGHYLGKRLGPNMERGGGCVLLILGIKVLLEGVGIW